MLNIDDRLIREVSPKIGPNALSVLLAIAIHLNKKTGRAFPSHSRLMELTGMGKNTVYAALKTLKECGLLKTEQQIDSKNKQFGPRTFRLTTRFISIFVNAEDAEPLPESREPESREPESREPESREPESWETQQLNKLEQLNNENELRKGTSARTRENEPLDLEEEKKPTPPVPAPPPSRANTADEAERIIRAWANGDGRETMRYWISETLYSEKTLGPVRDEITKFVGHYMTNERAIVVADFRKDPVTFFQNRFKAWLVQAKQFNSKPSAAAAPTTYTAPARRILE